MMTEELKQLEDPPLTAWEKKICSNRLPFSFFDSPCEVLAQNLLGNFDKYRSLSSKKFLLGVFLTCTAILCFIVFYPTHLD